MGYMYCIEEKYNWNCEYEVCKQEFDERRMWYWVLNIMDV